MKSINWTVRIKNKNFWITLVPAVLVFIQYVASLFGFTVDLGDLGNKLVAVINALFVVLAILGVVNDPTTVGLSDSPRAHTYVYPSDTNLDLTVGDAPIGDDNEEIKFDAAEDDGTYVPTDSDARI